MKTPCILNRMIAAAALCLFAAPSAMAQQDPITVTIEHSDRGAINNAGLLPFLENQFRVVGGSYQARAVSDTGITFSATRPYFVFSLAQAINQGRIISATLTFDHPPNSLQSPDSPPQETMDIFAVGRTSAAQLQDLQTPLVPGTEDPATPFAPADLRKLGAAFADLGDGTRYATFTVTPSDNNSKQEVSLNQAALGDLNNAIREGRPDFIFGADLVSINTPGTDFPRGTLERIFRGSDNTSDDPEDPTTLTLVIDPNQDPISAPVLSGGFGLALIGGLGGLGVASGLRRRKRS